MLNRDDSRFLDFEALLQQALAERIQRGLKNDVWLGAVGTVMGKNILISLLSKHYPKRFHILQSPVVGVISFAIRHSDARVRNSQTSDLVGRHLNLAESPEGRRLVHILLEARRSFDDLCESPLGVSSDQPGVRRLFEALVTDYSGDIVPERSPSPGNDSRHVTK